MKTAIRWGLWLPCLLASSLVMAQEDDWPCVQRFVPSISAAALWPFPELLPSSTADWRDEVVITELARRLVKKGETDFSAIDSFAAAAPTAKHNQQMAALFAIAVELLNNQRDKQLRLIIDFAQRQRDLSEKIIADQSLLSAGGNDETAQRLIWSTRVYDEREKRLRFLCERPILLEQRAFQIGRAIAAHIMEPQ